MPSDNDMDLLREYATQKSERAFEEIVRRHINFVYSAALRQTGNPHLAEEFTSAAFTILAQKAGKLKRDAVLSGWLFNTVRFVAATEFRRAARRKKYEQEAAMESLQTDSPDANWQHIVPMLDECLAQLSEKDRQTILLRFFEQKSFAEIGARLGTNADTATKRASRAVEKLRGIFSQRGIALSAVTIAALLSAHGVQAAPAGLAVSVAATAVVHGASATTSTATLIKGTLKLMAWTKLKTTAVAVVAVLALGAGTVGVTEFRAHGHGGNLQYLPDGTFIRLLSSSYGTTFSYQMKSTKPWERKLARDLPSGYASQFDAWLGNGGGSMSDSSPAGETNLTVVTATEQLNRRIMQRFLVISDQHGNQSLAAFGASTLGNDDGKTFRSIQAWNVTAFPRRDKTLTVQFIEQEPSGGSRKRVAEFELPNPAFAKYPVWTPEPLPITQTDGDLSVTMTGLATGLSMRDVEGIGLLDGPGGMPSTRAIFYAEMTGHPEQSWQPKSIQISDATGNKWTPYLRLTANRQTNGVNEFAFPDNLWPGEAAWKLRVEFSRMTGFDPSETWAVRNIAIPGPKQVIKLSETTSVGDAKLSLAAITGIKAKQPGNLEWMAVKDMVNISIRAEPWTNDQRITLVEAWDERGRAVEITPGEDWNNGNRCFGLKIPDGAKSLAFKFALHKSRFVEFVAAPEYMGEKLMAGSR